MRGPIYLTASDLGIIKHTRKHPLWEGSNRSKKQKIQIPKNLSIYKENSEEARKVIKLDKRVQQDDWTREKYAILSKTSQ